MHLRSHSVDTARVRVDSENTQFSVAGGRRRNVRPGRRAGFDDDDFVNQMMNEGVDEEGLGEES